MIASTREKPKKVLVITDSFPPEVVGGAELSLYNLLCKLNRNDKELVIASLSSSVSRLELQEYDGFKVYRVPFQEEWPKYTASARRSVRYLGFLKELLSHGTDAVKLVRAIATNVILHKRHPGSAIEGALQGTLRHRFRNRQGPPLRHRLLPKQLRQLLQEVREQVVPLQESPTR